MARKWTKQTIAAYRRALAGTSGYGTFPGSRVKATLRIGRLTGLQYGHWKEGQKISEAKVFGVVTERRADQVGVEYVAYSAVPMQGHYGGKSEASTAIEIILTPDQEKTRAAFYRNVKKLAQQVAADLAQREVIIEWDAPGRQGRTDTASPTGAPSPTNKRFCAWVRKHSPNAQTDPQDPCYTPRRKK